MRLSHSLDTTKESESIQNQRSILYQHLETITGITSIEEKIDDGYTGQNFNRPAFQEVLAMAINQKIDLLICKDFSRISRDMIGIGYLVEKFLPSLGVRLISVSDGYDSERNKEALNALDMKFRYVLSEYYSKDLSVKVKSAIYNRMERGLYLSGLTIYGYQKDEMKRLAIDEATAKIVRDIFNWYGDGMRITDICQLLSERKICTPSAYRLGKNNHQWSKDTVYKILSDERYTGTYIARKTKKVNYDTKKRVSLPHKDWIVIKNHHEPIISSTLFEKVQKMKQKKKSIKTKEELQKEKEGALLSGKIYCGHCHKKMQRKGKKTFTYYCRYRNAEEDSPCKKVKIKESVLEDQVLSLLQKQVEITTNTQDKPENPKATAMAFKETKKIEERQKQYLFEQCILGKINAHEYKKRKSTQIEKKETISLFCASQKEEINKNECLSSIADATVLTKKLVDTLIASVFVFEDTVEIVFSNQID